MLTLVFLLLAGCAHRTSPPYEVRARPYGSCVTAAPRDSPVHIGDLIVGPGDPTDAGVRASWGRALRTRDVEPFDVVVVREDEPQVYSAQRQRAARRVASFEEKRACEYRSRELAAQWRVQERALRPEREAQARRERRQQAVSVQVSEVTTAPIQGHFITRDGAPDVFVRRAFAGANAPVVIVCNGGPGQSHDALRVLEALADYGWTVVLYDQRGVGLSDRPGDDSDYSLPTLSADLDAVRQWSGASHVALLGHGWGATLALDYATRYPSAVLGIGLVGADAVHHGALGSRDGALITTHTWSELARFQRQLDPSCRPWARRLTHEYPRITTLKPSHLAGTCDVDVRERVVEAVGEFDLRPALADLTVPVLVWYGDGDPFHLNGPVIADALLHAQVTQHEEPACGHRPMFQCPDRLYRVLVPFLDSLTD